MKFSVATVVIAGLALSGGHQALAQQRMITFESKPGHSKSGHKSRYDPGKNSVTVGLASVVNGFTPFYYERALTPFLTIQVGAGITYRSLMNDLAGSIYEEGNTTGTFNSGLGSDISDNYSSYKHRKASIGQYFSISPRFYAHKEALDAFFVGAMLEYKNYRYKAQLADVTADPGSSYYGSDDEVPRGGGSMNEHMRCLDFTAQIGGHFQARSHLSFGWSIGFGARQASSERLDLGTARDTYDFGSPEHYVNATRSYSVTKPLFEFNFVMGGWF